MRHIMLDLETMGTGPTAAIVAIGAVQFDSSGCSREFYANVDLESAVKHGGAIDPDTVKWWLQQSEEARAALTDKPRNIIPALVDFGVWCLDDGFVEDHYDDVNVYQARKYLDQRDIAMWGNGSDFDNVVLRSAYQRIGSHPPWRYTGSRCYRTVKSFFPKVPFERTGTHHNALDDAKTQAWHLIHINTAAGGIFL